MYKNIFTNEYFCLAQNEGLVYIKVTKAGFNINDFGRIIDAVPRLKLTKIVALKSAIQQTLTTYIEIGIHLEMVEITVSKDQLQAFATLHLTSTEFNDLEKEKLYELILAMAAKENIIFGLDTSFIRERMQPKEAFIIAEGQIPMPGDDAVITLYQLDEKKPTLIENGNVNHYELNLINKVEAGEWMGERFEPTEGQPGRSVYGDVLIAPKGKQEKLIYDKRTIQATLHAEEGKTVLTAKRLGAAVYENGILSVCNYLEIDGRVSFETGNVDFDGYVDVKDIIEDNFSVTADQDIQVLGDLGVGAVKLVESREGDIYIRGGIAGQGKAEIICEGDLYTKFASDCTITCNGTVHVGFYLMNTTIKAKEVILASPNSRIIGGHIEADIRVLASEIGSRAEIFTKISIKGFSRREMLCEFQQLDSTITKLNEMISLLKERISSYLDADDVLSIKEQRDLRTLEDDYIKAQKSLKVYSKRRKDYSGYLKAKGEGEVKAAKCMHPNIMIHLDDDMTVNSKKHGAGISYYLSKGMICNDT